MVKELNEKEFDELIAGDKPVVCDFYAVWCNPCRMLAPVMEKVSDKYRDRAEFVKINIDDNPALAARYGIMSIPLVSVFKNGDQTAKSLGYMSQSEAEEFCDKNI